jgi:endonuclease G
MVRGTFDSRESSERGERAELKDYSKSGFDRGHMAPNADMPSVAAQRQCFTLANMIPQDPDNNRHLWEGIESTVRTLAKNSGELYVISGPLYLGSSIRQLNGRLLVPTNMFKIVYDPNSQRGAAYYVNNEPGNEWQVLSISEVEKLTGIDFFPTLTRAAKNKKLKLPDPAPSYER